MIIYTDGILHVLSVIVLILMITQVFISLLVSHIVYDRSGLYQLKFIKELEIPEYPVIVNIHAGFDESSERIKSIFNKSNLTVLDFYDPKKHTEISIKRARKLYTLYNDTIQINTEKINLDTNSVDLIVLFLSAHEIRDENERVEFFQELNRILKTDGKVILTEHLRDCNNFLAYNFGSFHFHSSSTWIRTFQNSGFSVLKEFKTTPFITNFTLRKIGTAF